MRRFFLLVVSLFVIVAFGSSDLYSRENRQLKKDAEKASNLEKEKEQYLTILDMLNSKDFNFKAIELEVSKQALISNVKLKEAWNINIETDMLKCYLPIYVAEGAKLKPKMFSHMNVTSLFYDYELNVKEDKSEGFTLTIKAHDVDRNVRYRFKFDIPSDGKNTKLIVSSTITTPVIFRGDILI